MNKILKIAYLRYIVLFFLLLPLCWFFPYTGDDWAWGSIIGLRRLEIFFDNYNGRYLGNLLVLVLTRSRVLRSVSVCLVTVGIIGCIERIVGARWSFDIAAGCIALLPRLILRQTFVWTSGFSNYTVSIFFTLVFFVYANEHIQSESSKHREMYRFLLFLLGAANTLFIENLTIFHIVAAMVIFGYYAIRERRVRVDFLLYLSGSIAGGTCMFSNRAYRSIASHADRYQQFARDGIFVRIIKNYYGVVFREVWFNNAFLNVLLTAFCIIGGFFYLSRPKKARIIKGVTVLCMFIMGCFLFTSLYCLLVHDLSYLQYPAVSLRILLFYGSITALAIIATMFLSIVVSYDKQITMRICTLWGVIILMTSPLLVVSPIGSRCFLSSYVMLILMLCELIRGIVPEKKEYRPKYLRMVCLVISCLCLLRYYYVYGKVYSSDNARLKHIYSDIQNGESASELYHLPFEDYLWMSYPKKDNDIWEDRYKLFFGIAGDFDLVSVK